MSTVVDVPHIQSCILYIYSTNIRTEYFKHGVYAPFFSLQNAVCFIILTYLVLVLFTFYIQDVLKLKKKYYSGAKRIRTFSIHFPYLITVEFRIVYQGTVLIKCLKCISFLAVQVIFICVYITNYLHFFAMFLSF